MHMGYIESRVMICRTNECTQYTPFPMLCLLDLLSKHENTHKQATHGVEETQCQAFELSESQILD